MKSKIAFVTGVVVALGVTFPASARRSHRHGHLLDSRHRDAGHRRAFRERFGYTPQEPFRLRSEWRSRPQSNRKYSR